MKDSICKSDKPVPTKLRDFQAIFFIPWLSNAKNPKRDRLEQSRCHFGELYRTWLQESDESLTKLLCCPKLVKFCCKRWWMRSPLTSHFSEILAVWATDCPFACLCAFCSGWVALLPILLSACNKSERQWKYNNILPDLLYSFLVRQKH